LPKRCTLWPDVGSFTQTGFASAYNAMPAHHWPKMLVHLDFDASLAGPPPEPVITSEVFVPLRCRFRLD